jgi:hypothetical protein
VCHSQEPWIIGLMCSHMLVLLTIVLTRNHSNAQACLFIWLSACPAATLRVGSKRVVHWRVRTPHQGGRVVW